LSFYSLSVGKITVCKMGQTIHPKLINNLTMSNSISLAYWQCVNDLNITYLAIWQCPTIFSWQSSNVPQYFTLVNWQCAIDLNIKSLAMSHNISLTIWQCPAILHKQSDNVPQYFPNNHQMSHNTSLAILWIPKIYT
jgi:hypothetical protein